MHLYKMYFGLKTGRRKKNEIKVKPMHSAGILGSLGVGLMILVTQVFMNETIGLTG